MRGVLEARKHTHDVLVSPPTAHAQADISSNRRRPPTRTKDMHRVRVRLPQGGSAAPWATVLGHNGVASSRDHRGKKLREHEKRLYNHTERTHKRSKLMRMRSEHCAVVLTQILHSGQLFAAFSQARTNTEAMSSVRDSHHAVRAKALQCQSQAVVGTQDLLQFVVEMQELETKEQLIVEEAYFDDPRLPETHRARPPTSTPSVVGGLVSHAGPSDAPTSTPTVVGGLVSKAGPSVVTTADDAARRTRVPIGNTYVNVLYMCQGQAQQSGAEGCCGMCLPPSLWGRSCSNMWPSVLGRRTPTFPTAPWPILGAGPDTNPLTPATR